MAYFPTSSRLFLPLIAGTLLAALAACTQQRAPSFATPWTGIIYPAAPTAFNPAPRPDALLADSDFFYPRYEKYIDGPMPLSTITASSEFTYDSQPVGLPGGSGYHYTYLYRENVSVP